MNDKTVTDATIVSETPKVNNGDLSKVTDFAAEKLRMERQSFVDEAFLRALPIALTVRDWTKKGEQGPAVVINSQSDRIKLAWEIAQESYAISHASLLLKNLGWSGRASLMKHSLERCP